MVLKEVIIFTLLLGISQSGAFEEKKEFSESSDLTTNKEISFQPKKQLHKNDEQIEKERSDIKSETRHSFEKDYKKWDEKQRHKAYKEKKNYMEINEIESGEYIDKYNKYGNTFNPNHLDKSYKKQKDHHEKHKDEKSRSLIHDTNVNYIKNNKHVDKDSEIINVQAKEFKERKNTHGSKEEYEENYQNMNEPYIKRSKKNYYQNLKKLDLEVPPPANETILMARYIVHSVDWAALATLSGRNAAKGAPFICSKAISDGPLNSSSGIPFFYMSGLDLCTQDLQKDNRVSVLLTLSETQYCKSKNLDPQDPRCAKLTLSGEIKRIKRGSEEEKFAKLALFSRHPVMESWPSDHNWYFAKLKIGQIILLDEFGGAKFIKVNDYLNGGPTTPKI